MKAYVDDNWGVGEFVFEDGTKIKIDGQLIQYNGNVGKAYSIKDASGHNGGHGYGTCYSCKAVMCDEHMNLFVIPKEWKQYNIEVL